VALTDLFLCCMPLLITWSVDDCLHNICVPVSNAHTMHACTAARSGFGLELGLPCRGTCTITRLRV
jgi:hypothetical protein